MKDDRKGVGLNGAREAVANDSLPAAELSSPNGHVQEKVLTSPAFDRWLERQVQTLFAACEEPADPKLIELIRKAFPGDTAPDSGKVTE